MSYNSGYTGTQVDNSTKKGKELVYWDDIQTNIAGAKLSPTVTPTWRAHAYGIISGVEFQVIGMDVNDEVFFTIQTFHAMKLLSELETHLHYAVPTDGATKKFKFQLDVIAARVNGTWTVLAGSPFTSETLMSSDLSTKHNLHELGTFPAVNDTVSTIYNCKLKRIAATDNEYGGEIYVEYIDGHYQRDRDGSETEYTKED